MKPLVSIIIPTYNRAYLIRETLQSIIAQTYSHWECIIVDDGSTDNTKEIIDNYLNNDERFCYFKRPEKYPKGAGSCRNYGFEKSKGKYIQWIDDDDMISINKIELQVESLESMNNPMVFTTCEWDLFWEGKSMEKKSLFNNVVNLSASNFYQELYKQHTFVPLHSFLMSRELILRSGIWNVQLTLNDDAEFICRILVNSEKLINTIGCHVLYRDYAGARISNIFDKQSLKSMLLSLKLMQTHLKYVDIEAKHYFKWKLKNVFFQNWKQNRNILLLYFSFFKENNLNLNFSKYYFFRYHIYKKIFPVYKFFLKKG